MLVYVAVVMWSFHQLMLGSWKIGEFLLLSSKLCNQIARWILSLLV